MTHPSKTLSFATITLLNDDLAEVIVHDGIEMDIKMVNEYHAFLLQNLKAPFSLLINKIHSYSYTFGAQLSIANLKEINAMAVVAYNEMTEVATEALRDGVFRQIKWNLKVFNERAAALDWLEEQQNRVRQA